MGVDEGNLQVIDICIHRRDTGKLPNNYCYS